jgi:hypothetical protein
VGLWVTFFFFFFRAGLVVLVHTFCVLKDVLRFILIKVLLT